MARARSGTDRRRLWAAIAVGALFALVIPLLVVGSLDDDPPPPPPPAEGVTDRIAYFSVRVGQSEAQVRRLTRDAPRDVQVEPRAEGPTECWVYGRRSGPGEYRFCFRSGFLVGKSRSVR